MFLSNGYSYSPTNYPTAAYSYNASALPSNNLAGLSSLGLGGLGNLGNLGNLGGLGLNQNYGYSLSNQPQGFQLPVGNFQGSQGLSNMQSVIAFGMSLLQQSQQDLANQQAQQMFNQMFSQMAQQLMGTQGSQSNPFQLGAGLGQNQGVGGSHSQGANRAQSQKQANGGTDSGVLFGAWIKPQNVGAKGLQQALGNFNKELGGSLGMQQYYTNENRGDVPDTAAMKANIQNGVTPMLSYRSKNYADVTAGKSDAYLAKLADSIKSTGGTVYLRMNWEMDGGKRQQFGTPEEYKKSWQYVHDFMEERGVTNIKYVWTPNAEAFAGAKDWHGDAKDYYPGDQYVDIIGADGYCGIGNTAYRTPDEIFKDGLEFAREHGKEFLVGETGADEDLSEAEQVKFMQQIVQWAKNNSDVKGICWFNAEGPNGTYDPMDSAKEWAAFKQMANDPYFNGTGQ